MLGIEITDTDELGIRTLTPTLLTFEAPHGVFQDIYPPGKFEPFCIPRYWTGDAIPRLSTFSTSTPGRKLIPFEKRKRPKFDVV